MFAFAAVEAAVTLCKIGEAKEDALALVEARAQRAERKRRGHGDRGHLPNRHRRASRSFRWHWPRRTTRTRTRGSRRSSSSGCFRQKKRRRPRRMSGSRRPTSSRTSADDRARAGDPRTGRRTGGRGAGQGAGHREGTRRRPRSVRRSAHRDGCRARNRRCRGFCRWSPRRDLTLRFACGRSRRVWSPIRFARSGGRAGQGRGRRAI